MFLPGDKVKYSGVAAFGNDRGNNLGIAGKTGEVIAKIAGEPNGFVVEFGDDAYVIDGSNLVRCFVQLDDENRYKPRRRRDPDLDEELYEKRR
jgi:hypothetical protein